MDEKLKHRLIGLAVIISLGAIFAPAVIRKSGQHAEGNFSVNVKLPPKPLAPDVVMGDEKEMFKTIKVARVTLPTVSDKKQLSDLVQAEPIKSDLVRQVKPSELARVESDTKSEPAKIALNDAAKNTVKQEIKIASQKPKQAIIVKQKVVARASIPKKITTSAKKPMLKKTIYAVQLASFSQLTNAQILLKRLHSKGYKANFIKQGSVYKVYVGHSQNKNDVMKLKVQLANAMQLNGFVVNTGVS